MKGGVTCVRLLRKAGLLTHRMLTRSGTAGLSPGKGAAHPVWRKQAAEGLQNEKANPLNAVKSPGTFFTWPKYSHYFCDAVQQIASFFFSIIYPLEISPLELPKSSVSAIVSLWHTEHHYQSLPISQPKQECPCYLGRLSNCQVISQGQYSFG